MNKPTHQFCGARMQMRYESVSNFDGSCKIHPYFGYEFDSYVLGYSFSDKGNICVFLQHQRPSRKIYRWLDDSEKEQFTIFLSRYAQKLEEEECHILVHTGAEESYGCDGFWLKERKRLYEMLMWA